MKSFFNCLIISLLAIIIFYSGDLLADEVYMKNGDRISGEVLNMKDSKLTIKTSYAGEINVKWAEVAEIKTEKEISILLSNDTLIKGNIKEFARGEITVGIGNVVETVSFSMAEVKSINPPEEPAVNIKARANIGITHTSGNTEKDTQHFDGEFSARTAKNRYTVGAELNRTEDSGTKTESNALGYLKYDHFLSKKWFAYSNALFEKDRFKDLSLRSLIGIGSGYQLYETKITNVSFEAGLNYVNDNYIIAADESYTSGRWAMSFDRYFYDKAFQLFHNHEGFVSLEDSDDMFIKSRTGIRVPLIEHVNASLQYNVDWDKSPSPGRKKSDKSLIFTLGYQFEN